MASSSLIDIVRSRFLDAIRRVQPTKKWKLLVVDDYVQKLMSATLKQNDILQENVTVIENINRNREPQSLDAIYIIMPTTQNVDRIISDFSGNNNRYAAAHLFFVQRLPDELVQSLVSSSADPYIKALEDLFLNFWPLEAQVFSVKSPGTFFPMYSPLPNPTVSKAARARLEEDLLFICKPVVDLCITLGELPYIRYYVPSHHPPLGSLAPPPVPKVVESQVPSRWRTNLARGPEYREHEELENNYLSRVLAFMVQAELDQYKKSNPDFGRIREGKTRATLLITDRSMDTIAPFLHEFTYQAMSNDLLPIDDGTKYRYKFQSSLGEYEDKVAVLSDSDSVWTAVRHMHMREAIDKLMNDFNKFLQENAGFKGEGAATLNDMKDMLASLPQYQEQREKFSLHLNMAQECMNIFERQQLTNAAHIEQCCATGLTPEGKSPKAIVEEMVPLLDGKDVSNLTKARIIALYIQFRDGVPDEDRRRLFQHARLPIADQDAINSLVHLGVRISRAAGDRDTKKRLKPKKTSTESEYELSRYQPLLRTVLEEQCTGKLDTTAFPYVKDTPLSASVTKAATPTPQQPTSLRSAKATWHKAPSAVTRTAEIRPRLMVFVAGGMTYSEMRTCYECSTALNHDIYIGSTHTLTPQHFVEDLRVLELAGVGSRALPKGFQHTGPEHQRPFQTLYDQRFASQSQPKPERMERAPPSQGLIPPSNKLRPSSSASQYSSSTVASTATGNEDRKKLKKKFFGF